MQENKRLLTIPVTGYSLLKEGADTYVASIQFLSRQAAKTQKLPGRIQLVLASNWRDKSAGRILQQLAEGTLKRGIASLYRRKRGMPDTAARSLSCWLTGPKKNCGKRFGTRRKPGG